MQDEGDMDHGTVVDGQLLVPGGDASPLLEPADQTFHHVAAPGGRPVVATPTPLGPPLVLAGGDHRLPPTQPQQATHPAGAGAAVARRPAHPQHGGCQQQVHPRAHLRTLPGRPDRCPRAAGGVAQQVPLGRQAAAAAAQSVGVRRARGDLLFAAPPAPRWAWTAVPSAQNWPRSMSAAASAWRCRAASRASQTSLLRQRWKRSKRLRQSP